MPLLYEDSADRAIKPGLTDALNLILAANQTFFVISNHDYIFILLMLRQGLENDQIPFEAFVFKLAHFRSSIDTSSLSNIDRLITLLSVVQPNSFSLLCLWRVWLNAFGLTTETEVRIPTKILKKSSEIESLAFHTQANWWLMALQIAVKKCFVFFTRNKT